MQQSRAKYDVAGIRSVSIDPKDMAEKSKEAIAHAMKSMQGFATGQN